jgi:3-phenylpropionate/cinnamic acid dioxygenase small subunit
MNPTDKDRRPKVSVNWNAGRSALRRKVTNVLVGASWSHSPDWPTRTTHVYLGLWTLTIATPSKGGKQ